MASGTIGVGVIGLGFMGRTHVGCYAAAEAAGLPCKLVAVCDPDPARLTGKVEAAGNVKTGQEARAFDQTTVRCFTEPEQLLADPAVSLVSICTYTDSHVDLALKALRAGKHVLVEKPIAVKAADVRRLAEAARSAKTLCMPAMCIRFWPGWDWLAARVKDGSLGRVRSATVTRMGSGPTWSAEFYKDEARSGGALIDLHIHDTDFVYYCFGKPAAVTSTGNAMHLTTLYHYPGGGRATAGPSHVAAEGAWDLSPSAAFRMHFLVNFEKASVEWDLSWKPTLRVHWPDRTEAIDPGPGAGYEPEVKHLVRAIAEGRRDLAATMDEAAEVAGILEAERRSFESGSTVRL
jgi:predicted dehydrogenase